MVVIMVLCVVKEFVGLTMILMMIKRIKKINHEHHQGKNIEVFQKLKLRRFHCLEKIH